MAEKAPEISMYAKSAHTSIKNPETGKWHRKIAAAWGHETFGGMTEEEAREWAQELTDTWGHPTVLCIGQREIKLRPRPLD